MLVGAPRAQSTSENQTKVNEPGVIYNCSLVEKSSCSPFVFDNNGNIFYNNTSLENEGKDYQWLGASMDGGENDNDKLVVKKAFLNSFSYIHLPNILSKKVCAPRMYTDYQSKYRLMQGICYLITNPSDLQPHNVQKIAPLRNAHKLSKNETKGPTFFYLYGEQGVSVHITKNNEEILIGAPGIYNWHGSVIQFTQQCDKPSPIENCTRKNFKGKYRGNVTDPAWLNIQKHVPYFGYEVSSGYFFGPNSTKLLYVASAPRANFLKGGVYLFDTYFDSAINETYISRYKSLEGVQIGEYFGYALLTDDFNNDGFTDLAISAPYNSKYGTHENGVVYIYINRRDALLFTTSRRIELRTDYEFSGRFGTTMASGDINQDGFGGKCKSQTQNQDKTNYFIQI